MLRHFKIVSYVRISFSVICSEEWKGVGRITDGVKLWRNDYRNLSRQWILRKFIYDTL